ncbi:hypothetical protein [Enterococcus gallinarum]|nr:hypothetical protein [Enterococcus gallinarum]
MDKKKLYTQLTQKIILFWQGKMDLIHDGFYGRRDKIPLLIRAA